MTEVNAIFSIVAGVILLLSYIPYGIDIIKRNVQPSRSARLMFVLLLLIALLQQHSLGSGWTLLITLGELLGSVAIFGLAIKYGVDGLRRLDIICYVTLLLTLVIWAMTDNVLVALHATIVTDVIAFVPTLVKTWRKPQSETPLFFATGAIAPLLGLIALENYQYGIIAFPLYLAFANAVEISLIYRHRINLRLAISY
jgi:hypothetical protein